jgi:exosome complex RNA-binding protein Rrp42 (RNase PH superfamily)
VQVRLTVGVNAKGDICAMQKGGRGGLPPSLLLEMLEVDLFFLFSFFWFF